MLREKRSLSFEVSATGAFIKNLSEPCTLVHWAKGLKLWQLSSFHETVSHGLEKVICSTYHWQRLNGETIWRMPTDWWGGKKAKGQKINWSLWGRRKGGLAWACWKGMVRSGTEPSIHANTTELECPCLGPADLVGDTTSWGGTYQGWPPGISPVPQTWPFPKATIVAALWTRSVWW